jgi:hypothetical protein
VPFGKLGRHRFAEQLGKNQRRLTRFKARRPTFGKSIKGLDGVTNRLTVSSVCHQHRFGTGLLTQRATLVSR